MANKSDENGSKRNDGVSPQWTVRFSNDINDILTKMREDLNLKSDASVLRHIVTIYLAERRLIK